MSSSCGYCETSFPKPRANRLYCDDRCRKAYDRTKAKCGECGLMGVECPGMASKGSPICMKLLKRLKTRTESRTQTRTNPDRLVPVKGGFSKRGKIEDQNGGKRRMHLHNYPSFLIIPDGLDYVIDPLAWHKIKNKKGKWIGKYSHTHIRTALGYPNIDPETGDPPFSAIKGRHTRKLEININEGAGISTPEEAKDLLNRIRWLLEDDMNLPDGSLILEAITWKKGPEKGKRIQDLAVIDPLAVKIGQEHPGEIPLKVEKLPDEDHENAILDGSHPNAWEYNDEESAGILQEIQDDAGILNPHDPDEWEKTQRASNNIQRIQKAIHDPPEDFITGHRGGDNLERILKSQEEARGMIGGIYFDQKHQIGLMKDDIRGLRDRQDGDHNLIDAMAKSVQKLTEVAGDLLEEHIQSKSPDLSRNRRERMRNKIIDLESVPPERHDDNPGGMFG